MSILHFRVHRIKPRSSQLGLLQTGRCCFFRFISSAVWGLDDVSRPLIFCLKAFEISATKDLQQVRIFSLENRLNGVEGHMSRKERY